VLRWVLQLAARRFRSSDFKELEIVVLRHELAILRRHSEAPACVTDPDYAESSSTADPSRSQSRRISTGNIVSSCECRSA
jgi:hypothetical protein